MPSEETIAAQNEQKFDFFVYGTLCVPAVLVRVLGRKCEDLKFQDAILPDYTRHSVKSEDYPAIIGRDDTAKILPSNVVFASDEYNTRGTLVSGLTYHDVQSMDIFEGTEYSRRKVTVQTLSPQSDVHSLPEALINPKSRESLDNTEAEKFVRSQVKGSNSGGQNLGPKECWTYVWSADLDRLEPKVWEFQAFIKDRASLWVSANTTEYDEVDRHRALQTMPSVRADEMHDSQDAEGDGDEALITGRVVEGYPDFGHGMLDHFQFEEGYLNMNQGSYGSVPKSVAEARQKLLAKIEANPDRFMRKEWLPLLKDARQRTAEIIGATADECMIVPNTTHGVNTIVNNIRWEAGDRIMIFSSTYGAVAQMMKYYCDANPQINLDILPLPFPLPNDIIVERAEEALSRWNKPAIPNYTGQAQPTGRDVGSRVRLVIVDSIASNPGVVMPWERLVGVCKKYGVLSLVDGAHSIGQHKVDVDRSNCDFFVTNCHKWLFSARSAAVMYVPTRNQHLVRSSFPVGAGYESSRYPTPGIDRHWDFGSQYEWNGTCDWSAFFSIKDGLEFREKIGGEERIMEYCHTLAVEGGKRLSRKWGTRIMENPEKTHTAAMVNVELPYIPSPKNLEDQFKQLKYLEERQFELKIRWVPYVHEGKWWGRFSAQIFLELSDFDKIADISIPMLKAVRDGEYLDVHVAEGDKLHRPEDVPTIDE